MKILIIFILGLSLFAQDVPDWILKTQDSKYFYGVGSAKKGISFSRQFRIARMLARANLSENISTFVQSDFSKKRDSENSEIKFISIQTSKHLLKNFKILKRWESDDGEIFILLGVLKNASLIGNSK